ncbi:uncharacterized protein LTR77_010247 [Saxophila tyrrhenica]|uniref:Major facilitator superfamily (MFS) profile domain-containing protein n=1 Tax=Saxophila tyrrhenica TaxID=1690608 RepID=A0AAV9NX91_9PEZI|nr:hypothetical protein LTR77_010247 [Saxophila tyrrhenica]
MAPNKPAMFKVLTPRLVRVYLFASNFGYDNNWWSGVIALDRFVQDYGKSHGPGEARTLPSSWLSAASGTPLVGWILGCALASYLNSRFGRKKTLVILCIIALVGMIIQCAVANYWALMVGRLINSFSMGKPIQSPQPY